MLVYLVIYTKRILHSEQPNFLLARRHLNTMILTNFENLNSISNIFQETHHFLVFADAVIICICFWHFRDQGNVRHPTSKLLKCDLIQTLNTFRNPFRIFSAGKASLISGLINNAEVSDLLLDKLEKNCYVIDDESLCKK